MPRTGPRAGWGPSGGHHGQPGFGERFKLPSGKPGLFLILERFILEGRADQSDEFRHFIIEYGQILHDMDLPTKYW